MKTTSDTTPRLYVGTYSKYNSGSLKGEWLNLDDYRDRDAFLDACAALHADEEEPELMFQDFEGFPRAFYSESSAPPDILWEWMELSEAEQEAFGLYADNMGGDVTIEQFRDAYCGCYDSVSEFAEQTADDCVDLEKAIPAWIVIDWEATWNCNLRHDYFEARGPEGVHIFRNI